VQVENNTKKLAIIISETQPIFDFAMQRYNLFLKQTNKLKYFFAFFLQTVRNNTKYIYFFHSINSFFRK